MLEKELDRELSKDLKTGSFLECLRSRYPLPSQAFTTLYGRTRNDFRPFLALR